MRINYLAILKLGRWMPLYNFVVVVTIKINNNCVFDLRTCD